MVTVRFSAYIFLLAVICSGCGGSSDNSTGPPPTTTTTLSGPISSSGTWSGTVRLVADADIVNGVQIAVAAGTVFEGAQGTVLQVHGSLAINGTPQKPVRMQPAAGASSWGGIVVESGGAASVHNATGSKADILLTCKTGSLACVIDGVVFSDLGQILSASSEVAIQKSDFTNMSSAGVVVLSGGNVTITDSVLRGVPGDLVTVNGGALTVSYCDLGAAGSTQHGDIFVSSSSGLNVSYSNIAWTVDGVSIGGTSGGQLHNNNFTNNDFDVISLGSNAGIDMSSNYWDDGPPASLGSAFSVGTPSAVPILGAGPRT